VNRLEQEKKAGVPQFWCLSSSRKGVRECLQNTYPRLERLEAALHGVDNLAGRTIAMDTMAADLAVHIPTLNTTPISTGEDGGAVYHTTAVASKTLTSALSTLSTYSAAAVAIGAGLPQHKGSHAETEAASWDSGNTAAVLDTVASFVNATQSPEMAAAADATRKSLATGQQPRTIKALHSGLQDLRKENEALRMYIFSEPVNLKRASSVWCTFVCSWSLGVAIGRWTSEQ
jgi:hypothetical protein